MHKFELLNKGSLILKDNCIPTPVLDAELILSNILNQDREILLSRGDQFISEDQLKKFQHFIKRRSKNEPIAYILNRKEFWKDNFFVDKGVLVPRPETELLVEEIIKTYQNKSPYILDIGTGSGCIILSILRDVLKAKGVGLDISKKALKIAKRNANMLKLDKRILFVNRPEAIKFQRCFDLIVSNPPYVSSSQLRSLPEDIKKYEPTIALNGGYDGLDVIKKVIYKVSNILKIKGMFALEIGNGQYLKVSQILKDKKFREKKLIKDYRNNIRCIISILNN